MSTPSSASPGSCTSTGTNSFGASLSSSCLTCTETDVQDVDMQNVDAFFDDMHDLCGSCASVFRFGCIPLENQFASGDLRRVIREDLEKQRHARVKVTSAAALQTDMAAGRGAPLVVRRLPAQHRSLIVGWMREVTSALRLQPSTLFTATSMLDRFIVMSKTLPPDGLLQLLALTCMSVAVKYNEVGHIAPDVWLGLAVNPMGQRLYTPRDLQRYEFTLLQTIDWNLNQPTTHTFLEHFLMCLPHGGKHSIIGMDPLDRLKMEPQTMASRGTVCIGPIGSRAAMLAESTLMYDTFLSYDSSAVALACIILAEQMALSDEVAVPDACRQDHYHQQHHQQQQQQQQRQQQQVVAAAAVAAVSGLRLELIAPELDFCVDAAEKCFSARYLGMPPVAPKHSTHAGVYGAGPQ
ncbi:hypothetical protein Vretimale_2118 [Volvox reticuliferus]|uniref:Uncharacterized protein n=1 Tax=Volvox reticuliferus TaxID=1737510 RepID=A0A8J4C9R0_9CHLO|nr:hypothetical protein Vretifemale_4396 [Volvox reticuliferus]GIL96276.1 hypothetical protein Vretimale_2118 [Volvox reticuliferus]